jgi:hypothetical protein
MGWSIGYDEQWKRDIGYGVLAWCDHPDCNEVIDRGLGYVCGGQPYGGQFGCGLYFCGHHLFIGVGPQLCERCDNHDDLAPFNAKPDHPDWINHKATDPSWAEWRKEQRTVRH